MKAGQCAASGFGTRRERRETVRSMISILSAVRDAERRCLDNVPDSLQSTDSFESGEHAVDALDEAIGLLADVY